MIFVNRNSEIERIRKLRNTEESVLLILYGRRRTGKTRLLQQLKEKNDIFFTPTQNEKTLQLRSMASLIAKHIPGFDRVNYPDWESLFFSFNERLNKSLTLIIDEFPYLVKNAPELPGLIQKLFDRRDQLSFHLFLCGSSQQMMHNLVIDSTSPLYGRANEIIKLLPLSIDGLVEVLNISPVRAVEEYSVWGGIPRYWELRSQNKNLEEAIVHHILDRHGVLYEEPFRLFLDDSRDTVQMSGLITLVASGVNRLSEIASRMEKPSTHLNRPLQKLIDLGYLKREVPYGSSHRNAKKTLYKVADPFMNFFFRYVVPERSLLELGHAQAVYDQIVAPDFPVYCSAFWEELCRESLPLLFHQKLFNPGLRWWGTGMNRTPMEIDIISSSADGTEMIAGEAKWQSSVNINSLIKELNYKIDQLKIFQEKKIHKVLFLKNHPRKTYDNIRIFTPHEVLNAFQS